MELTKSRWAADENNVSLTVPFAKIDKENRVVSGFATLDNVDTSDDVVLADASSVAFERFRGNIREMHQPIAAGRLVKFREDSFYDNGEFYNGIYVDVYVSKGAQSTWEKVLDGTLSGFSIGGNITEQSSEFVKDANGGVGKTVRFIKEYDLVELSLVDNPANQLANVFSIVKNNEGSFIKGMVAETELVNVFWCPADEIAKNSAQDAETCNLCGNAMAQIGWFERGEDAVAKTANSVASFLRQKEGTVNTINGEGGVTMSDEVKKDAEVEDQAPAVQEHEQELSDANSEGGDGVVTTEDVSPVETTSEVDSDESAEAESPAEADAEPDFEKMFDDLKDSVKDSIAKTVEAVEKKVEEATKAFDEKASEFEKSIGELSEKLDGVKNEREDVAKRLDALEKNTAIKKSGEVESEPVEKKREGSFWSGTFFKED